MVLEMDIAVGQRVNGHIEVVMEIKDNAMDAPMHLNVHLVLDV